MPRGDRLKQGTGKPQRRRLTDCEDGLNRHQCLVWAG
jgi:hypothetical protein